MQDALPDSTYFVHDDYPRHTLSGPNTSRRFFGAEHWRALAGCFRLLMLKHPCTMQRVDIMAAGGVDGGPLLCQRYSVGALDPDASPAHRLLAAPRAPASVNLPGSAVPRKLLAMVDAFGTPLQRVRASESGGGGALSSGGGGRGGGGARWLGGFTFVENAQLLASRTTLRSLPRTWYERALEFVRGVGLDFTPIYVYERIWHLLLGCPSSACELHAPDTAECTPRMRRYAHIYRNLSQTAAVQPSAGASSALQTRCEAAAAPAHLGLEIGVQKRRLCQRLQQPATATSVPPAMRRLCRLRATEMRQQRRLDAACRRIASSAHLASEPL